MENRIAINKNRKLKVILCYFGIVILIILLALPPVFRTVFTERKKVETSIVTVLSCEKAGESISSTFLNDVPQNILYIVGGDYSKGLANPDELDPLQVDEMEITTPDNNEETNNSEDSYNPLLDKLKPFSEATYDEASDTTSLKIKVESMLNSGDYELIFANIAKQELYYESQGFTCTKKTSS